MDDAARNWDYVMKTIYLRTYLLPYQHLDIYYYLPNSNLGLGNSDPCLSSGYGDANEKGVRYKNSI